MKCNLRSLGLALITTSSLLVLSGCSSKNSVEEPIPPITDSTGVEKNPPNTSYSPAFPGQTRIGGVTTAASWEGRVLTSNLSSPWGIAALPDNR